MSGEIDYEAVEIPTDEPPAEYHYTARRAEILNRVRDAGGPRCVNPSELAREFDVSRRTIYNDLDTLAEYVDRSVGGREALDAESLYWRCITALLDDGEYRKAAQTFGEFSEWLHREDLADLVDRIERLEATANNRNSFQLK